MDETLKALKSAIIRQVLAQETAKDLAALLRSLAGDPALPAVSEVVAAARPAFVAGQLVGSRPEGWVFIPLDQIVFGFLGSVIPDRLIDARWVEIAPFDPGAVYVRTGKGVFRTALSSLAGLRARLDERQFAAIHRSLIVNTRRMVGLDNSFRLIVQAGNEIERLRLSRRKQNALLKELGISRRGL